MTEDVEKILRDKLIGLHEVDIAQIEETTWSWDFLDQLWVHFRMKNDICLQMYPDVSTIIERYQESYDIPENIKFFSECIFTKFIQNNKNVVLLASSNKNDTVFCVVMVDSQFFCFEMGNFFSDLIMDCVLKHQLDPTKKTIGIFIA